MVGPTNLSDVFISYSRRDTEFARRLFTALKDSGREVWADWEDIPLTANWWAEIRAGIEATNTFLFVISPDSVQSKVCYDEIEHAVKTGKRLVPVLYRDVVDDSTKAQMHVAVNSHNWVFFRESDVFDESFQKLISALDTDLDHVRKHTRFLVRAREWDARGRDNSFLMTGTEITEAEAWLGRAQGKQPPPTALHLEFITTSQTYQRIRRRNIALALIVGLVITGLAILSFGLFQNASTNLQLAEVRGTEARNQALTAIAAQSTADYNAEIAATNAQDAILAQGTADANAEIALTNAADALRAQFTADANANLAATSVVNALRARATSAANAEIASTNAAEALIAQGTAETLKLTAEGDALLQAETAVAALATSEQRGTEVAIQAATAQAARAEAQLNAERARAISLASLAELSLADGNTERGILLALAAMREYGLTWEAERVLGLSVRGALPRRLLVAGNNDTGSGEMALSRDGRLVAVAYSNIVHVWPVQTNNPPQEAFFSISAPVTSLAFSPNGAQLLMAFSTGRGQIISLAGEPALSLEGVHTASISRAIWSPNGQHILMTDGDGLASVWTARGELVTRFSEHAGAINDADWASNNRDVVTVGAQGQGFVWDALAGSVRFRLAGHVTTILTADWSPDGLYIGTAGLDSAVIIWDARTGQIITEYLEHIGRVTRVRWSPQSRYLASAGDDRTVRIWDIRGTVARQIFIGHTRPLNDFAWSADSTRLASVAGDDTLRIWNITLGGRSLILASAQTNMSRILWTPDERHLITTGANAMPTVWRVWQSPYDLRIFAEACCETRVLTAEESVQAGLPLARNAPPPPQLASCPSAPPSRLYPDSWGQVDNSNRLDRSLLNVRRGPGTSFTRFDQIAPGQPFRVVEGPVCEGGLAWFRVIYGINAADGWVAEGDANGYFAAPLNMD